DFLPMICFVRIRIFRMKLTSSLCVPVCYVSRKVAKEQRRKEESNCENNRKLSKSHHSITIKHPVNT
ncbi:MAG: hypothetical protein ACKO86_10195, partial [Dolichospermum sp.]